MYYIRFYTYIIYIMYIYIYILYLSIFYIYIIGGPIPDATSWPGWEPRVGLFQHVCLGMVMAWGHCLPQATLGYHETWLEKRRTMAGGLLLGKSAKHMFHCRVWLLGIQSWNKVFQDFAIFCQYNFGILRIFQIQLELSNQYIFLSFPRIILSLAKLVVEVESSKIETYTGLGAEHRGCPPH